MSNLPGFRTLTPIGTGASALIRKGEWAASGRIVAIKSLREGLSAGSPLGAQLEAEGRMLAKFSHPNIVLLIDVLKHDGLPHLVLEYIDGENLRQLIERRSRLTEAQTCAIASEVLRGLAYIHSRGYLHRDVKPENVLLSKEGTVKLCDLGLARPSDEHAQSKTQEGFGSPHYMAPEVLLGERATVESDLYAVGIMMFEMLAGRRPYEGDERARAREAIPLHAAVAGVSKSLERFVSKLMHKRPDARFSSAQRALEELLRLGRLLGHGAYSVHLAHVFDSDAEAQMIERVSLRAHALKLGAIAATFLTVSGALALTRDFPPANMVEGTSTLPLVPKNGGLLRAVATPWAEVWIDGVHVETTPFARAIPLTADKHIVTFKHPNAPSEERRVDVRPGETVMMDVQMQVDLGDAGVPDAGFVDAMAPLTRDPEVPRGKLKR